MHKDIVFCLIIDSPVKENDMRRIHLSASQNGIVRFDRDTDKKYVGLQTADLQTCWAIIIYNERNDKASLLHKTLKMNPRSIIDEFTWVGIEGVQWTIVHNTSQIMGRNFAEHYEADLLVLLENLVALEIPKHREQKLTDMTANVTINRDTFNVVINPQATDLPTEVDPGNRTRYFINLINDFFLPQDPDSLLVADLQYDAHEWTELPKVIHDLSTLDLEYCELFRDTLGNPNAVEFLAELLKKKGNEYFGNKDYEKAKKCYKRAVKVKLDFSAAWYNLGMALQKLDRSDDACRAWKKCLAVDPRYTKAAGKLQELQAPEYSKFLGRGDFARNLAGMFGGSASRAETAQDQTEEPPSP